MPALRAEEPDVPQRPAALTPDLLDALFDPGLSEPSARPASPAIGPEAPPPLPVVEHPSGGGGGGGGTGARFAAGGGGGGTPVTPFRDTAAAAVADSWYGAEESGGSGGSGGEAQAWGESYSTHHHVTLTVGTLGDLEDTGPTGVLLNDQYTGSPPAPVVVREPAMKDTSREDHGFKLNPNGSFTYTSVAGWVGTDSFDYKIGDAPNATATVTIEVDNSPPTAREDDYAALDTAPLEIGADDGLLANDTDPEIPGWEHLRVIHYDQPLHGHVDVDSSGAFSYDATDGYAGYDEFAYVVSDGIDTATSRARVAVNDLRVFYGGADVTGLTTDVWIGAHVGVSVGFGPNSAGGLQIQGEPHWSVPDGAAEDYVMERTFAELLPFTDVDGTSINPAWITSGAKAVSVTATVVGRGMNAQQTLNTTFNVKKPNVDVLALFEDVHLWDSYDPPDDSADNLKAVAGQPVVQFGDWQEKQASRGPGADIIPGMQFQYTSNATTGAFQWVQVADVTMIRYTDLVGAVRERSGANVLDGSLPYGHSVPNDHSVSDSPWNNLLVTDDAMHRVEQFSMYLMYKPVLGPDAAVWVALSKVTWHWQYDATSNNGTAWQFVPGSVDKGREDPVPDPEPPEWTGNYDDLTTEEVNNP